LTTPENIQEQIARLRDAGAALRRRPIADVVEALGAVLEGWRDPNSQWRKDLETQLPAATGFFKPLIRKGLEEALHGWTSEALRALAIRELGPLEELDTATGRRVSSFDLTAVLLAGSIPMPSLLAILAPLVVRSSVLAKPAARDPITPLLVARSITEVDPELGRCVEIANFEGNHEGCMSTFLQADCIFAMGSDAAIAAVQAQVRPPRRLVVDGHRLSLAVVAPPADAAPLSHLADRLALDVALWNQLGCLSPIAVFVVGNSQQAGALAEALALALGQAEKTWPRGSIDPAVASSIARERAEAELRQAAGRSVAVHGSDSTAWTVILEDGPEPRLVPLHRFIRVIPVADHAQLLDAVRPMGPHLAAVAIEGFEAATNNLTRALADLGASRICAPGTLQRPPLDWRHGGRGVLTPLVRFTDFEPTY
jgi:hypothetical protein